MQLKNSLMPWHPAGLATLVITALLYVAVTSAAGGHRVLSVPLAGFVPLVAGMLFGLPGAIGAALGSLALGVMSHAHPCINGCVAAAVFFMGYLPHRLWYGLSAQRASLFVCSGSRLVKFILIAAAVLLNCAVLAATACSLVRPGALLHQAGTGFIVNLVIATLIAVPFLTIWRTCFPTAYCPVAPAAPSRLVGQTGVLVLVTAASVAFLGCSNIAPLDVKFSYGICAVILLGLAYVCTMPSAFEPEAIEQSRFMPLAGRVIAGSVIALDLILAGLLTAMILHLSSRGCPAVRITSLHGILAHALVVLALALVLIYLLARYVESRIGATLESMSGPVTASDLDAECADETDLARLAIARTRSEAAARTSDLAEKLRAARKQCSQLKLDCTHANELLQALEAREAQAAAAAAAAAAVVSQPEPAPVVQTVEQPRTGARQQSRRSRTRRTPRNNPQQ